MKLTVPHLNLVLAWLWILLGFGSGLILGMNFHREDWLGGYGSFKRRLYRLGHISFFGLAAVNLLFYFTAQAFAFARMPSNLAAWAFILGALTMPSCCYVVAQDAKWRHLFAIPVLSLISGGTLTLWELIKL